MRMKIALDYCSSAQIFMKYYGTVSLPDRQLCCVTPRRCVTVAP